MSATCLNMIGRGLQIFFVLLFLPLAAAIGAEELAIGSTQRLAFEDVDGNNLSTAEGRVTIVVVVTRESEEKAVAVADLVPDRYIGDPAYRYITLVNFQRKLGRPLHGLTRVVIRNRLDAEAKKRKDDYEAKKLTRDPRSDLHVVADFDGSAVEKLGLPDDTSGVVVFVFNPEGKLLARWNDVPPAEDFVRAISLPE